MTPLCRLPVPLLALLVSSCGAEDTPENLTAPDAPDAAPEPRDGAGDEPDSALPPRSPFIAANSVAAEDPLHRGEQVFLYEGWGAGVASSLPPASFLRRLQQEEPEVFGNQFERFGFVPDPSRDLPIGLVEDPSHPGTVAQTCALCHTTRLPDGRLWIGAPATSLDFGAWRVAVEDRWVAAGNAPRMTPLEREKNAGRGPGRASAEGDDYPRLVPADYPVYWDLAPRTALNYMGTGQDLRTEAYFALWAFGCENPTPEEARVPWPDDEPVDALLGYLASLTPPDAPPGDEALVRRGAVVFEEAGCGSCHHPNDPSREGVIPLDRGPDARDRQPGEDPAWPRGSIATSAAHRVLQDGDGDGGGIDARALQIVEFILRRGLTVRRTDGYRVNSLRGLWATAPYLHNGSVPTLEDLLQPPGVRPVRWMQGGVEIDTTRFGFGNGGHSFGTDLSPADREALVAWLRSL